MIRNPGQVGYPLREATDAQLGFSVVAYQSAELLFDRREGNGRISVRLVGTRTWAHKARKEADITHRAKVGLRPCCTRPTHVAAPSRYLVGGRPSSRAEGISLLKEHGPWAVRRFAAFLYAYDSGYLPSAWDWAAQSFVVRARPLFDGTFGTVHASNPAVSPPPTLNETEADPRPKKKLVSNCPSAVGGSPKSS